jgi:hypothetical protein
MAGPIAVRSTQFGEGEHGVFAGDIVPKTLTLFLKQSTKHFVLPGSFRKSPAALAG